MAGARCSCGFAADEAEDYAIGDHLLEMFAPDDDKGADGRCHLEGESRLTCTCGLAVATAAQLDAHFLAMFTPDDAIGRDGKKHQRVTVTARTPLPDRRSSSAPDLPPLQTDCRYVNPGLASGRYRSFPSAFPAHPGCPGLTLATRRVREESPER